MPRRMRTPCLILPVLLATVAAAAPESIRLVFEFSQEDVSVEQTHPLGYDRVRLRDSAYPDRTPGLPRLPARTVLAAVPPGAKVTGIRTAIEEESLANDVLVVPVQEDHPPSLPAPPFTGPDPKTYAQTTTFPAQPAVITGTHLLRDLPVVALELHPVRYVPARRELRLAKSLVVTVDYVPAAGAGKASPVFPRNVHFDRAMDSLVVTPQDTGHPGNDRRPKGPDVDYLLITRESYTNTFQALIDHRASAAGGSYSTAMVTREWVYANFTGQDNQAKIRNCIRAYVQSNNTAYVCLGGSSGVIPDRNTSVSVGSSYSTHSMPTDLYYSDLDGTWNADGDSRYGEAQEDEAEMDMMPDVIVGRIVIDTAVQAADYINKLIEFETNFAAYHAALGRSLLMAGQHLWSTYSGDSRPHDIFNDGHVEFYDRPGSVSDCEWHCRKMYRDDIRPDWEAKPLRYCFDTLTSWDTGSPGSYQGSGDHMRDQVNASPGFAYSWIWTHGGNQVWTMEGPDFNTARASELTRLMVFVLTGACNTGSFDASDSLSEAFIWNPNGGALAYIGSSRYGWSGSSPQYARKFWREAFDEGKLLVGDAFAAHKAAMVSSSMWNGSSRWLQFGINLQGDPAIPLLHTPRLEFASADLDDGAGNADGFINAGETIDLTLNVRNAGFADAENVQAAVSTSDPYVSLLDGAASFGTVTAATVKAAANVLRIDVTNTCPTPHPVPFSVVLTATGADPVTNEFSLTVYESTTISGRVSEVSTKGPIAGATIEYTGPSAGQLLTGAGGDYSFTAVNGTYRVRARKEGYATGAPREFTAPPGGVLDFELGAADMVLIPTNLLIEVPKSESGHADLVVSNAGNVSLHCRFLTDEGSDDSTSNTNLHFWWQDISAGSTELAELDEDDVFTGPIPIGFEFPYYGQVYTSLYVSANGWIGLEEPSNARAYNRQLPYSSYEVTIAFFWDDLDFNEGGRARYATVNGDAFVLTFEDVVIDNRDGETVTAQLVLNADGTVLCQYKNVGYGASATVGYQDLTRTRGHYAAYNGSGVTLTNDVAIRLYPGYGTNWLWSSVLSGSAAPGSSTGTQISVSSSGLMVGDYDTTLDIACNDPDRPYAQVPVRMSVLGNPTNHAPVASNVSFSVAEDHPYPGTNLNVSVYDADGDTLGLMIVDWPDHGYFSNLGDPGGDRPIALKVGDLLYVPDRDYHGPDQFTYKVTDYEVDSNVATGTITVASIPDAPDVWLSAPASGSVFANGFTIPFNATATDDDGNDTIDRVEFWTVAGLALGTDAYDGDTLYSVQSVLPEGTHTWHAVAIDLDGLVQTSAVRTVTVNPNVPPVADAGTNRLVHAGRTAVLDGGSTVDDDNELWELTWQWEQIRGPSVSITDSNAMTASFVPTESGDHEFQLAVSDGEFWSTDTVVYAVNVLPTPHSQSLATPANTPLDLTLTYDDPDGPGPFVLTLTDGPSLGSVTGSCATRTYIPNPYVYGRQDSFTFTVHDGAGESAKAEITIFVGEPNRTNWLPYAESFELYAVGPTVIGRNGWYAQEQDSAVISTNPAALYGLTQEYGGDYPLQTNHTRVLEISEPVSNCISTANLPGERIRNDLMVRPHRLDDEEWPNTASNAQAAFCFDTNGQLAALLRVAPAADPSWHILTNAPVVQTGEWVRLTWTMDYSATPRYFQVRINDGTPVVDEVGVSLAKDTGRSWFLLADQDRDYMSEILFKGKTQIDDIAVSLSTTNELLAWLVENYPGAPDYGALPGSDTDGDGATAEHEWAAGTKPHDASSVFAVCGAAGKSGTEVVIQWNSVDGKVYAIEKGTNLLEGFTGIVTNGIPGVAPMNTCTVTVQETGTVFLRVIVDN